MCRSDEGERLSTSTNEQISLACHRERGRRISLAKELFSRVDTIVAMHHRRGGKPAKLRESSAVASSANSWENRRSNRSSARIDTRKESLSRTTEKRNCSMASSIGIHPRSGLIPMESVFRSRRRGIDSTAWASMVSNRSADSVQGRRVSASDTSVSSSSREWNRRRLFHWSEPLVRKRNTAWRWEVDRIANRNGRVTEYRGIGFPNTGRGRRHWLDWSCRWLLPSRRETVSNDTLILIERSRTYWSSRRGNWSRQHWRDRHWTRRDTCRGAEPTDERTVGDNWERTLRNSRRYSRIERYEESRRRPSVVNLRRTRRWSYPATSHCWKTRAVDWRHAHRDREWSC